MTEILFSAKHLAESVRHGCKHSNAEKTVPIPEPHAENRSMLCPVSFALRTPSGSPAKGCKQGGTVGLPHPERYRG